MIEQVGPYRVIEQIGAGAMGEVYLAEDPRLGRRVALKRLAGALGTTANIRERLLFEAGAAATLNHPNIAGIYDVLEAGGEPYIVMEHVPGETLAARLRAHGPMPPDRIVPLALQICDGLAEAHAHGVVHRDLKPANIRVTPEGRAKILDFGLAHRKERPPVVSDAGPGVARSPRTVAGTPVYMAPEQLLGKRPDPRADVYSLGVTLFELATGRRPFEGTDAMSVALAIVTEAPPDVLVAIPGGLGVIIARAMAREPSDRYQSVMTMRRDLAALSADLLEMPTGTVQTPRSFQRERAGAEDATESMSTLEMAPVRPSPSWWRLLVAFAVLVAAALVWYVSRLLLAP